MYVRVLLVQKPLWPREYSDSNHCTWDVYYAVREHFVA